MAYADAYYQSFGDLGVSVSQKCPEKDVIQKRGKTTDTLGLALSGGGYAVYEALVGSIKTRVRDIRLGANSCWSYTNPANAVARRAVAIPADKPYLGQTNLTPFVVPLRNEGWPKNKPYRG